MAASPVVAFRIPRFLSTAYGHENQSESSHREKRDDSDRLPHTDPGLTDDSRRLSATPASAANVPERDSFHIPPVFAIITVD
jgi:hypothetical protein